MILKLTFFSCAVACCCTTACWCTVPQSCYTMSSFSVASSWCTVSQSYCTMSSFSVASSFSEASSALLPCRVGCVTVAGAHASENYSQVISRNFMNPLLR